MRALGLLLLAALPTGCATPLREDCVEPVHIRERWLPPIENGCTTIDTLGARLGQETRRFESGSVRVWVLVLVESEVEPDLATYLATESAWRWRSGDARSAYRERLDRHGRLATVSAEAIELRRLWPTRREAEYHLIVSVDDHGVVQRHSLLRVLP